MRQGIIVGQHTCENGVVTLRPGSSGSLRFKFTGAAGPEADGILHEALAAGSAVPLRVQAGQQVMQVAEEARACRERQIGLGRALPCRPQT